MRINLRHNLSLKLFSAILAIVCWYVVRGEEERVKDFSVPLEYTNLPPSLDLSGRVIDSVAVRLRAARHVQPDLERRRIGARDPQIPARAEVDRLGQDVMPRVDQVNPDLVKLRIDRKVRREVPVVAEFSGSPPAGYEKVRHVIDPPVVTIEGPANEVTNVPRALTGIILLDGETADYEVDATPIPDAPSWSRVRVVSPQGPVRVRVTIARAGAGGRRGALQHPEGARGGAASAKQPRRFGIGRG